MPRGYANQTDEFDTLIKGLFGSHGNGHGFTKQEEQIGAVVTDALAESLRRVLSQASPIERALFVQALAPALADALAPALADALAPALAEALGDAIAPAKVGVGVGVGAQGKGSQEKETGTTEPPRKQDNKPDNK